MIGKKLSVKKDVFLADCRNGTHNDSNHIGRFLSDQKYCSVMGWDGIIVCAILWMLLWYNCWE